MPEHWIYALDKKNSESARKLHELSEAPRMRCVTKNAMLSLLPWKTAAGNTQGSIWPHQAGRAWFI